jgi:hypothetical protein
MCVCVCIHNMCCFRSGGELRSSQLQQLQSELQGLEGRRGSSEQSAFASVFALVVVVVVGVGVAIYISGRHSCPLLSLFNRALFADTEQLLLQVQAAREALKESGDACTSMCHFCLQISVFIHVCSRQV